jgi:antitoxin YefM
VRRLKRDRWTAHHHSFAQYVATFDIFLVLLYSTPVRLLQECPMTIQTTYTQARAQLATLLDQVTNNREVIIIQRRGADDVALIAADELTSLLETAHLLRSPANAARLLTALARARQGLGTPQSIDDLRREVGFAQEA